MPRGVITSYDPSSGTGIITAEDGNTYPFDINDVDFDSLPPTRGTGTDSPSMDGIPSRRVRSTDDNDKD